VNGKCLDCDSDFAPVLGICIGSVPGRGVTFGGIGGGQARRSGTWGWGGHPAGGLGVELLDFTLTERTTVTATANGREALVISKMTKMPVTDIKKSQAASPGREKRMEKG
jgi:hypothetical protein